MSTLYSPEPRALGDQSSVDPILNLYLSVAMRAVRHLTLDPKIVDRIQRKKRLVFRGKSLESHDYLAFAPGQYRG